MGRGNGTSMENEVKKITQEERKNAIQSALFHFTSRSPFMGTMLTEMSIKYTNIVPTAAITYNSKLDNFEILLNDQFFCGLELNQRIAILLHEVLHFTNQHLFRLPFITKDNEERKLYNIAGDMAINQYIQDLPPGCINVDDWKDKSGQPFPKYKTMEEYYLLMRDGSKKKKQNGKCQPGEGEPQDGQGEGQSGQNPGQYENVGKSNAGDNLNKFSTIDEHLWDQLSEEQKEQMLNEAKKMIKRTIEKTSFGHSVVPDTIKDLLEEIEVQIGKMNYKAILRAVIKKTVSCVDRDHTWNRPNKRYGVYAPGSTNGKLPKLLIPIDTSGSISLQEMNTFVGIMDKFLQVGNRSCELALWHTEVYHKQKYKLGQKIQSEDLQSGGTDIEPVLEYIKKATPDLSIILTDGYYDSSHVKPSSEVIFIISKGGNKDHPLKHLGKTIPLDALE
jgi:predicted metal-dependent peptidase